MKFKISNISITDKAAFQYNIHETIVDSINLINLDLSWCKLAPKDLYELTFSLIENSSTMRNLNLSYNNLHFAKANSNVNEQDIMYSEKFITNLLKFLKEAIFINHVDFSGMNLK